jgi:hypothetical protein
MIKDPNVVFSILLEKIKEIDSKIYKTDATTAICSYCLKNRESDACNEIADCLTKSVGFVAEDFLRDIYYPQHKDALKILENSFPYGKNNF